MVMCNTMDTAVIPRPPALPLGPIVPNYPLKSTARKGPSLPPPPPPPKPLSQLDEVTENNDKEVVKNGDNGEKKLHKDKKTIEERRIIQKMVEKNIARNESVRSKMSVRSAMSQRSNGFRLIDNSTNGNLHNHNPNQDETSSVYSIYKQKIDSMFESDSSTGTNHNSVQAKIEKMFTDVAKDSGIPASQLGTHAFSVDYLGSVPLQDKVTSLAGLQQPLRDLYFAYKKMTRNKKMLSGRLEISGQGLRVQYQGTSGDLEQMNSFPTIAVWSAVKFVIQETNSMLHGNGKSYAFLPLITDPDNMDKQTLFRAFHESEIKYISSNEQHSPLFAVVMRKIGVQKQLECHGFVCQTSEDAIVIAATLYKSLVNHMKHKEKKPKNKNGVTCMSTASSTMMVDKNAMPVRPPRRKRSSAASSVCSDSNSITNISDTQPLLNNSKPLKKSTKTKRAPKAPSDSKEEDLDAIVPYEEPIRMTSSDEGLDTRDGEEEAQESKTKSFSDKISNYMSKEQKQITEEIKQVMNDSNKGLKRVPSLQERKDEAIRKKENSGDIFTKVTIPRSGSFLNTGGLTRYKNKGSRNNESASGGSPLGFKEIFHELSMQENLHSMDEILSVIIDPDGMSFNDLKPIYKEFLLKLALTLTKDELYMKSKSIMRRHKKKTVKRSLSAKRNPNISVSGKFKRLKHIFQKTLKPSSSKKLLEEANKQNAEIISSDSRVDSKLPESSISTSSYDTRPFRTKDELVGKKTSYKKKTHGEFNKNRRRDRTSTSEESDFFSLKRQNKYNKSTNNLLALNQNRNSSSGYVSCSECSYDSDTCTCVSADKCYCSLGHRNFESHRRNNNTHENKCAGCAEDPSLTYCGCDTDSCAESNKCYCQYGGQKKSRSKSHSHYRNCNKLSKDERHQHRKLCKSTSNTKSTRSLEYMANPSDGYYEKLRSKQKFGTERVPSQYYSTRHSLQKKRRNSHTGIGAGISSITNDDLNMVALQNAQMALAGGKLSAMDMELLKLATRNDYAGFDALKAAICGANLTENMREYWSGTRGTMEQGLQKVQSAITTGACTDALSVKKSAEIAALFADVKLSQTTDITHLAPAGFDVNRRNNYNMEKSIQAKYSKPNKVPSSRSSDSNKSIQYHQKSAMSNNAYARPNSIKNKSKLYAAKNGLYTIQSQSDESRHSGSRRSSLSAEGRRSSGEKERYGSKRNISTNIENSLGYLP